MYFDVFMGSVNMPARRALLLELGVLKTSTTNVLRVKTLKAEIKSKKALGATTTTLARSQATQRIDQDSRLLLVLVK